jgi:hypothetical protein
MKSHSNYILSIVNLSTDILAFPCVSGKCSWMAVPVHLVWQWLTYLFMVSLVHESAADVNNCQEFLTPLSLTRC